MINEPGDFFAIATLKINTADSENGLRGTSGAPVVERRYDASNALETRLLSYYEPPVMLSVTSNIAIVSGVPISIAVGLILFLLYQVIANLDSKVMNLTQGSFLVVLLFSAMLGTLSTFLFNPVSDLYCVLDGPLVYLPITLMYSIVIGRLWRANAVISAPLSRTFKKDAKQRLSSKCFEFLDIISQTKLVSVFYGKKHIPQKRTSSLRVKVTSHQLARIVLHFTLPQIVLQALALILQPDSMVVHFNEEGSVGQVECANNDIPNSLEKWSVYYLAVLFIVMLGLAHESRNLPSLFNEIASIYDTVLVSILIVAVGLVVIRLSDTPTTPPDVDYILKVVMVLSMSINTTFRILGPKLKLIWSKQNILVSHLISDSQNRCSLHMAQRPYKSSVNFPLNQMHCSDSSLFAGTTTGRQCLESAIKFETGDDNDATFLAAGGYPSKEKFMENSVGIDQDDRSVSPPSDEALDGAEVGMIAFDKLERGGTKVSFHFADDGPVDSDQSPYWFDTIKRLSIVAETNVSGENTPNLRQGKPHVAEEVEDSVQANGITERGNETSTALSRYSASTGSAEAAAGRQHRRNREALQTFVSGRHSGEHSSVNREKSVHTTMETSNALSVDHARHFRRVLSNCDPSNHKIVTFSSPKRKGPFTDILISDSEAPGLPLLLKMFEVYELLDRINRQIITGLCVSHKDWHMMREACVDLGDVFKNDVKFQWEEGIEQLEGLEPDSFAD